MSPASFFAYLDVVKALYVKQQEQELSAYELHQVETLVKVLMADLFGPKPIIRQDPIRYQIIALLQQLYPDVFEIFLRTYLELNEKASKVDGGKKLNPKSSNLDKSLK